MTPSSLLRQALLAALAYVAVLVESTAPAALAWGPLSIRPLWIVLALAVADRQGVAVVIWAASLGFLGDCLHGESVLGVQLVMATLVVSLLPASWQDRPVTSTGATSMICLLVTGGIDGFSPVLYAALAMFSSPEPMSLVEWVSSTWPPLLVTTAGNAVVTAALTLAGLATLARVRRSITRLLLPAPLAH